MIKIFVASFNRASDGAISKLKQKMIDNGFYTDEYFKSDWVLAVGDRTETFDFVLKAYRDNKPIIHLWAGEIDSSWSTKDEVYRHAITLMSNIQLCTNDEAKRVVKSLCKSVGKKYIVFTVGNVMLDNLETDESAVIEKPYDLILYNPPTTLTREKTKAELDYICKIKSKRSIWIQPNGDVNSDLVSEYVTIANLSRPLFLGLLKNCDRFITNSSCQHYEAPFLIKPEQVIPIGVRNSERSSKYSDMCIPNASDNIIKIFRWLDERKI